MSDRVAGAADARDADGRRARGHGRRRLRARGARRLLRGRPDEHTLRGDVPRAHVRRSSSTAGCARELRAPDYPWGRRSGALRAIAETRRRDRRALVETAERVVRTCRRRATRRSPRWRGLLRLSASPGALEALDRMNIADRRPQRPARDPGPDARPAPHARTVGRRRATAATWPSGSPAPRSSSSRATATSLAVGRRRRVIDEIERFLRDVWGRAVAQEPDRVLATVLFTDIVGSTAQAAELGDRALARAARAAPRARPARSLHASAAARSTPRATASSPPSTGPRARSAARARSARPCASSASRSGPACTPASAS